MKNSQYMTVVGSAALDSIETPHGFVDDALGGSSLYIAASGSLFAPVHVVSVVGDDFPLSKIDFLKARNVNLDGLEIAPGSTFRWSGRYHEDMNIRDTLSTELGVFEGFDPELPFAAAAARYLLLANINPALQMKVLEQVKDTRLVAFDTMNLWIQMERENVEEIIPKVDIVILNDQEIGLLTGEKTVLKGCEKLLEMGTSYVVAKKGEHGAILFGKDSSPFLCPAYPIKSAVDPTGAGDSFAGAMMGYLAATDDITTMNIRRAVVYGTVTASFTVEDFSLNRLENLTHNDLEKRFRDFREMVEF